MLARFYFQCHIQNLFPSSDNKPAGDFFRMGEMNEDNIQQFDREHNNHKKKENNIMHCPAAERKQNRQPFLKNPQHAGCWTSADAGLNVLK